MPDLMRLLCCCCCCSRGKRISCPEPFIRELKTHTVLTTGQIQHLFKRFCFLCDYHGDEEYPNYLRRGHFFAIGDLRANPVFAMILTSMFGDKKRLSFVEFATYLSKYQANSLRMTRDQLTQSAKRKKELLFNMYDTDRDGVISQNDLIKIVHKLFGDHLAKKEILNLVDIMMTEVDSSNTNQILFDDFCKSLEVFDMAEKLVTFIPSDM